MKVHLLTSSEPVVEGSPVTGLCEAEIGKSMFLFSIQGELQSEDLTLLGNCRKCARKWMESKARGRYVYGVAEASECEAD
jgi:hypothetical protein